MENIAPPPPRSDEERGTFSAEQLQSIVGRALHSAKGNAETVAGQMLAQREAATTREEDEEYVAARAAQSQVLLDQARTDGIASGAKVGLGAVAGGLVLGPVGALAAVGLMWAWDRFNDPFGR